MSSELGPSQAVTFTPGQLPRAVRTALVLACHLAAFVVAYWTAFLLRFDFDVPASMAATFRATVLWVVGIKLLAFYVSRHFRGWWRHVAFSDLVSLLRAAVVSLIVIAVVNQLLATLFIPRVVLLIDFAASILLLGGLRSSWRMLDELLRPWTSTIDCRRALLVGADKADKMVALKLQSHPNLPFRICGFLDRDRAHAGEYLGGVPILGPTSDVAAIAAAQRATDVIVIAGALNGDALRKLRDECEAAGLQIRILPPVADLLNGDRHIPLRSVDINDLLPRDPVQLDLEAVCDVVAGKTVLVTGAGGSIGSEICRQLLRFAPRTLVLVDHSEGNLFNIEMELRTRKQGCQLVLALADVTDAERMRRVFESNRPQAVFHVAAYKHVPMLESHPSEAIKNNVFGTARLAELAHEFAAERFIFISTDKVVNPSSVMGVSKNLAEHYVHAMSAQSRTRFVAVRFGNVLGSAGSVVPVFKEQIRRGGPVIVTHPDMRRFFMTIDEAAQLVLQASAMGQGGEIFVLNMGEQVRIVDLAKDLIRLSGLPPHSIDIVFSGPRPGEKLYEELFLAEEKQCATSHPKLNAAFRRPVSLAEMRRRIEELRPYLDRNEAALREKLKQAVPEYVCPDDPAPTKPDLDRPATAQAAHSLNVSLHSVTHADPHAL